MAKEVQRRRGTTAEHSSFTGAIGEITVDTDKQIVIVHDGSTVGGFPMVRNGGSENVAIGITTGDGTLHVHTASAGSVTASGVSDDLVLENNGRCGISILTPNSTAGSIFFGDPESATIGQIAYNHADNSMAFVTNESTNLTIDSDGNLAVTGDITANNYSNKNVIINGNFDIWQRGTSLAGPTSAYLADRWRYLESGAGVVTYLQSTSTPDNLSQYSLQIDVTTADASLAASDIYKVEYRAEGFDVARFGFGTSDAQILTLSFWVRSSKTGTHCVSFRNSAQDRSYVATYSIAVADTWEEKSITITADTSGTWLTDKGKGLHVTWALAVGSDFHATADSWQAGNNNSTSGQVNCMDNIANNFHLSRVQLEIGSVATGFERRSIAEEFALCQRYYEKSSNLTAYEGIASRPGEAIVSRESGTIAAVPSWFYSVRKRTTASVVVWDPVNGGLGVGYSQGSAGPKTVTATGGESGFTFVLTGASVNEVFLIQWAADAEL